MAMQEGIYYQSGQRPGQCLSIMFLRVQPGATAAAIDGSLTGLSSVYSLLRTGRITDLPGVDSPAGALTVLIGYGPKAFAVAGVRRWLPQDLGPQHQFRPPAPPGGGTILVGSALSYAEGVGRNPATEEIVVQAIADTPLAASRPIVETAKYLDDNPDQQTGIAPLQLASAFTGFNREDGRSWIDFHDGVSNLTSGQERLDAVEVKPQGTSEERWTEGGTYMSYLRLAVDVKAWRKFSQQQQEMMVGRSKLSGCPIIDTREAGVPVPALTCPFAGTRSILEPGNEAFREPPASVSEKVLESHVQRANHHLGPVDRDVSRRIFRQGYEFLEAPQPGHDLVVGLNFISFQDTLGRLFFVLTTPGWLGSTNFGGATGSGAHKLLTVLAAGVYLCPPVIAGEKYPGQSIFV